MLEESRLPLAHHIHVASITVFVAIYEKLLLHSYSKDKAEEETNQVFDIAQRQEEYDA